jgi:hypothetical protein
VVTLDRGCGELPATAGAAVADEGLATELHACDEPFQMFDGDLERRNLTVAVRDALVLRQRHSCTKRML